MWHCVFFAATWEEQEELVLFWRIDHRAFDKADGFCRNLAATLVQGLHNTVDILLDEETYVSKMACLRAELLKSVVCVCENEIKLRCLVFVQQRIAACVLSCWIGVDPALCAAGVCTGYIAARGADITLTL